MKEPEREPSPLAHDTVEALRAHLRAPGGDGYWDALHAGIMARIAEAESQPWWIVLNRWASPALAAAAVLLLLASAAMVLADANRPPVIYADVVEAPVIPVQTARNVTPGSAREATFQFVMSSNGGRTP